VKKLVLVALGDARDIPAGVPSRAPQHQLAFATWADAMRDDFAPHNGLTPSIKLRENPTRRSS